MAVQTLKVDIDDKDFMDKLTKLVNENPNILAKVLRIATERMHKIGPESALSGGIGLAQRTGNSFRLGFKSYIRSSKKSTRSVFWANIANLYTGKGGSPKNIPIMRIAEKAFARSGGLESIVRAEMDKVYNDN
jgi:hypothetical protein